MTKTVEEWWSEWNDESLEWAELTFKAQAEALNTTLTNLDAYEEANHGAQTASGDSPSGAP